MRYIALLSRGGHGIFFDRRHCSTLMFRWPGESERGLGECLAKFGDRDQVVIATKGGHPDFRFRSIRARTIVCRPK